MGCATVPVTTTKRRVPLVTAAVIPAIAPKRKGRIKMVIILLIIIVCALLFGKEETKSGITCIIEVVVMLAIIATIANACGLLE